MVNCSSPSASTELVQDVVGHSINSNNVQKQASKFKDIDNPVSTDLLNLEDDATNVGAIGASSFDRNTELLIKMQSYTREY